MPVRGRGRAGSYALRIGILTSIDTRHRYFAQALRGHFEVVAAGYEQTGYHPASVGGDGLSDDERRIVEAHFAERSRQETRSFGDRCEVVKDGPLCGVRMLAPGELNAASTLAFLQARSVDTLVVYGTNLIKPPLLDAWPGRIVNLHLGLSPYYRGTATNFYPLLNEEPEYVGATIHLIDAGIDSGPILRHARPRIVEDDGPHTIGCKAILAGIDAMIASLRELDQDRLRPIPQWRPANPRLYLRKDYHNRQVVELYRKLADGLIPRYVERIRREGDHVRLVDGGPNPNPEPIPVVF